MIYVSCHGYIFRRSKIVRERSCTVEIEAYKLGKQVVKVKVYCLLYVLIISAFFCYELMWPPFNLSAVILEINISG